ncbi:MAG: hypothetical protein R2695_00265 [Acidimicrobiales bacterium]
MERSGPDSRFGPDTDRSSRRRYRDRRRQRDDHAPHPGDLSAPAARTVTIDWTTVHYPQWTFAAADPAADYVATSGTITFAPGETVHTADVVVNGDLGPEPDELVVVSFRNPVHAARWVLGPRLRHDRQRRSSPRHRPRGHPRSVSTVATP